MGSIISIVTPSLNQARFISYTIESVLSQKGDFYIDYVIIDGGSVDNSKEVIIRYEKLLKEHCTVNTQFGLNFFVPIGEFPFNRCKGISYRWISEKDEGHGHALNKGFALTVGSIMGWLNSDDIYLENAFANVVEVFTYFEQVKWLTGVNNHINEDGSKRETSYLAQYNYKNIFSFLTSDHEFIQQESTLWKRELWEKAGGYIDNGYNYMVDGELWCRFFLHEEIYHLNRPIGAFRWYEGNRSSRFIEQVKSELNYAVKILWKKAPPEIKRIASNLTQNKPIEQFDSRALNFKVVDKRHGDETWSIYDVDFLLYSFKRNAIKKLTLLNAFRKEKEGYEQHLHQLQEVIKEKKDQLSAIHALVEQNNKRKKD